MQTIAAKTTDPHPNLPGTIYTAAKECEEAGIAFQPVMFESLGGAFGGGSRYEVSKPSRCRKH